MQQQENATEALLLGVATFVIDASKDVIQHPVEQAEVNAFNHPHVIEGNVQAALLRLEEFAAVVSRQTESG